MSRIAAMACVGRSATADHEVVGVVDDVCSQTLFVPEHFPPQHEPSHVEVAQQR